MPYLPLERRRHLGPLPRVGTEGDLTYVIFALADDLVRLLASIEWEPAPRYKHYAAVLGAIESAKLEWYRRRVAPYENDAINRNGDIER